MNLLSHILIRMSSLTTLHMPMSVGVRLPDSCLWMNHAIAYTKVCALFPDLETLLVKISKKVVLASLGIF